MEYVGHLARSFSNCWSLTESLFTCKSVGVPELITGDGAALSQMNDPETHEAGGRVFVRALQHYGHLLG